MDPEPTAGVNGHTKLVIWKHAAAAAAAAACGPAPVWGDRYPGQDLAQTLIT